MKTESWFKAYELTPEERVALAAMAAYRHVGKGPNPARWEKLRRTLLALEEKRKQYEEG